MLCSFSYEMGREAARGGVDRNPVMELKLDEPMNILAWKSGYDDESTNT